MGYSARTTPEEPIMKRLLAIALLFAWIAPLGAAEPVAPAENLQAGSEIPLPLTACPPEALLAQVSQGDCCKGHKGVCGCRAGKIVCCDNTTSPNCACHADSGVEN
jgi:hypothetical protein